MSVELLIANQASGLAFSAASCAQSINWETNRTGSPGKLTISMVSPVTVDVGDAVRFTVDGQLQFYGWVFTVSRDRWGAMGLTCYDTLRYLKASASYAFYAKTAGDIIRQIGEDFQLPLGDIQDTGYPIPSLIESEQSCLDIISSAVQETLLATGQMYIFYDNGSGLSLAEASTMTSNVVLGEGSLVTEYTDTRDIDQQTYNSVKLAIPNEETGRADVYIAQDSNTIGQWGLLQLYQTMDGDVNAAQAKAQAEATLSYYNRVNRSLSLSALGIPGLRAGQLLYVNLPDLQQFVMLERVSHTWEDGTHTMEIDTLDL